MREAVKTGKEIILLLKKPIYQEGITKVDDNQLLLGEDLLDIAREHENRINEAEKSIQSRCLHLLLHQAPVAHDLRYVSAALKMITDLERIGDQAVDIAEMSVYIKDKKQVFNLTHILEMADNASKMVTEAIDAFVKSDIEVAKKVARQDDIVDNSTELCYSY